MLNQRAQQNRCKTGREGQLKTKMETHSTRVPASHGWALTARHFPSVKLGVSESKAAWLTGESATAADQAASHGSQSEPRLSGMREEPAGQAPGFPLLNCQCALIHAVT